MVFDYWLFTRMLLGFEDCIRGCRQGRADLFAAECSIGHVFVEVSQADMSEVFPYHGGVA